MNVRSVARTSLAAIALTASTVLAVPALHAQFNLSVTDGNARVAPPPLAEVEQPEAPGDGYIWTPGYWAWDDDVQDYYWVDGEWVMAPEPGLLWTPGYWNYDNGGYRWNAGYWGEHVGFYGGVNYGFGYGGNGYDGGYWQGDRFFYNTAVNRIDLRRMRYTYQRPVSYPRYGGARVAFNGGPGGINLRPSRGEEMAFREQHFQATHDQQRGWQQAREDRGWNSNRGNGDRSGWNGDRGNGMSGRDSFNNDRNRTNGGWSGDRSNDRGGWNGNNGFRNNGGAPQPPATNQPGNGQQDGWQGNRGNGSQQAPATNQPGSGQQNGWRGNRGQQPPVSTQPSGFRWNGPGDGNNRPVAAPPSTRPFPAESRSNGAAPNQPPTNNDGWRNRGNGGSQQPPQQQPRPQGGNVFGGNSVGGGERPSFNRGGATQQPGSGIRSFGRF